MVIRLSSFGDIVLTFPLLKKLRKKFPESEIHFLTKDVYEEVVKLSPSYDKIILLENSLGVIRKRISEEKYDVILDLHKNPRSFYLSFMNADNVFRYKKENFKKFLLVNFKINLLKEINPVYRKYLETAASLLDKDEFEYETDELFFPKDNITGGRYIAVSPSSRHFTKTYPADKFIEFINSHPDRKFVLVGDKSERDISICNYIESKCGNVLNMCGKLNIKALANILSNSDFVICNDSAALHLAEATGRKVVAVFGSTVKEFGFFPQLGESSVIQNQGLKCRPCSHIGLDKCPEGHFNCMNVEIENVKVS